MNTNTCVWHCHLCHRCHANACPMQWGGVPEVQCGHDAKEVLTCEPSNGD